jgi:quinol monooxygenase YgiN
MLIIVAEWYTQAGQEDEVADILMPLIPLARAEPGCLAFTAQRSVADPRHFILYEQFVDQAAFDAHISTAHFKSEVLGRILPLLERRVRTACEPLGPTSSSLVDRATSPRGNE